MTAAAPTPEPDPASSRPTGQSAGETAAAGKAGSRPSRAFVARAKWMALSGRVSARRPGLLYWQRRFAGTPEQISEARRFTRFLLADSAGAADAAWIVGELATNAVRHSRSGLEGGVFTVEVMRWRRFVQVQVTDAGGGREPVLPRLDPTAVIARGGQPPEGGLGLFGVGALACRFGTHQHLDGSRVVWARLPVEPPTVTGAGR